MGESRPAGAVQRDQSAPRRRRNRAPQPRGYHGRHRRADAESAEVLGNIQALP